MIKTFRGILPDNTQNRIRLSTKKGKIGYRIVKFQVIAYDMPGTSMESVCSVFKVKQTGTMPLTIDFADGNLLACAYFSGSSSPSYTQDTIIIFDSEVFNQDIYITHNDSQDSGPLNYYLELETMNMTDNAAAVSTLRDIRLNPQKHA
jgi:hypothetical protein